jgi:FtsP/CotA-like multicopper oxidase with cupredoxin domain
MKKLIKYLSILSALAIALAAAPAAMAGTVTTTPPNVTYAPADAALYPPGIGFNPKVDYTKPQFAQSPNLRKFVDSLPGLGAANANNLGQYIPIANPDTTSYPGSDYYEIGLKLYNKRMHTDLPTAGTALRGYYQKNAGTVGATDNTSQYLGPVILAHRNRAVRFKFFNELPTGTNGDLPLAVDTNVMGAGAGPTPNQSFRQNRAAIHLHGGFSPWISDGTPHQWITPAGDTTPYKKGAAFQNVPDMVNGSTVNGTAVPCIGGNKCFTPAAGDGTGTFFWTNEQSGRLMFYHDHAYGTTRLNVYAGEAAGYLLTDQIEEDLIAGTNVSGANPAGRQILPDLGGVYHWGIPLIIQDKAFVNDATVPATPGFPAATSGYARTSPTLTTDPLWAFWAGRGTNHLDRGGGNLWFPHEYYPIENMFDPTGNTPMGRFDYAPFMNPPMTPMNIVLPSPSIVPETFVDTAVVNGTAFPYVELPPDAIRLRILNACNDRSLNLQIYKADPLRINVTNGGTGYNPNSPPNVTISGNAGTYTSATAIVSPGTITAIDGDCTHYSSPPTVTLSGGGGTCSRVFASLVSNTSGAIEFTALGCTGFTSAPTVNVTGGGGSCSAPPVATIIPAGVVTAVTVNGATGYRADQPAPTVTIATPASGTPATAAAFVGTEVVMVDAAPNPDYPTWPKDGRDGGVPDPTMQGPPWIQIGNESGLLAQVAEIPQQPVGYEYVRQALPMAGVTDKSLLLMAAQRADVILDLRGYKDGDTLIVYNDAPAPMPGFKPTEDYYTDDPDNTGAGGAPTTPPGFGPNTRTIMQIRIKGTKTSSFDFDLATLKTALPKAFAVGQDKPLVPQLIYNDAFPGFATSDVYVQNFHETINISGTGQSIARIKTALPGNGYATPPTVNIVGGGGSGALATAGLNPMGPINLLTAGSAYTSAPTCTVGPPLAGGVQATCIATVSGGVVSAITIDEPGSNYNINPLAVPPTCTLTGGGGTGATCSVMPATAGLVGSIRINNGGSGYTSQPYIIFSGGGGTGAQADALLTGAAILTGKNITEGFDPEYGRLNVILGSTPNPLAPAVGNGPVIGLARYIDPPTEILNDNVPIYWRIMHLGVDSHALHFHLFDVQVVNRVDFSNVVKPPYADEVGWRETIRTNAMEDIIVAARPHIQTVPFPMPTSNRLLDVTNPVNVNTNFLPVPPPLGVPAIAQITNTVTNFGFEYVWHCHLLGHEENDMMRPIALLPPTTRPPQPVLTASYSGGRVNLNWTMSTMNSTNQVKGFTLQRRAGTGGTFATVATFVVPETRTYVDTTLPGTAGTFQYRVGSFNNANALAPRYSSNASVTVTAFAVPSVTLAAPAGPFAAPATIALTATPTAGGTATVNKVDFFNGATLIGTATAAPYTVNWTNVPLGTFTATAVVTNSNNVTATSAPVTVTVGQVAPPQPPTVTLTAPAGPFTAPATILLTATPTAGGTATVTKVDFYNAATLIGTATAAPYTFNWTNVPAGTFTLTAIVTNSNNATATSAPATVTVGTATGPVTGVNVTATPGSPQAPGTTVTFTPTATGGSGNIEYQLWVYNPVTAAWTGSAYGPTPVTWNTTGLPDGTYNIQVFARNVGATADYEAFTATSYTLSAAAPVTAVSISATPASPAPVATTPTVTFNVTATGGANPQFQLWVYNPATQTWSSSAYGASPLTWSTTGLAPGTYDIQIWSRSTGSTATYEAYTATSYVLQ